MDTIIPIGSLNGHRDLRDRRAQMLDVTMARIVAPSRRRTQLILIEVDTGEPRPSNLRLAGLIPIHHVGRVRLGRFGSQVGDIIDIKERRRHQARIADYSFSGPSPMLSYNPNLIGKLLNRAGHPGTLDVEALIAVRKAYASHSARV